VQNPFSSSGYLRWTYSPMAEELRGLTMLLPRARRLNLLFSPMLSVLLIGSMDLSFGEQMEEGAPFLNDSGSST
jgi:hypothetical protein